MTAGERFKNWIDGLSEAWKDRLRGWMRSWVAGGIEDLMDDLEPITREQVRTTLTQIRDLPETPPEYKKMIDEALETKSFGVLIMIVVSLGAMIFGMVSSTQIPHLSSLLYSAQRMAEIYRLDPATITRIWLRDKPAYEELWEDLRDQGWDEDRLAVAKELAKIIPPLPDMVRFADFSAFDPEVIAKWREFYDAPGWISEPFELLGVTNEPPRDWANKYWFSHWIQPGRYELGEIYRRGLLGEPLIGSEEVGGPGGEGEAEKMVKLAYRTMGYSAFWQEMLLQLVREVPTRVDVRRWWDMRTIDEAELRSIYQRRGYFGKDLENYVVWTKVYVAFPDLIARWSKGWITEDDVRSELLALNMPAERVEEMIQTKKKAVDAGKVDEERDLTKSEIYTGVKKGVITREEGIELLEDLNYTMEQAEFILNIHIPKDEEEAVEKTRELTKADILTGLKTAIITEEEAQARLEEIRYAPEDARTILAIFKAAAEPPIEAWQREASKADIVAAVKKGLITPENAYLMLQDIGFSAEAAHFILMVRAEVSPFSPINFPEFKDITQRYKIAIGKEERPMPEELKKAAEEVVRLTGEVEALKEALVKEERGLVEEEVLPEAATEKRDELRLSLHRAEAELKRVKTEYDSLVAEWRHGE